jgi:hypothetical protein
MVIFRTICSIQNIVFNLNEKSEAFIRRLRFFVYHISYSLFFFAMNFESTMGVKHQNLHDKQYRPHECPHNEDQIHHLQ